MRRRGKRGSAYARVCVCVCVYVCVLCVKNVKVARGWSDECWFEVGTDQLELGTRKLLTDAVECKVLTLKETINVCVCVCMCVCVCV